MEKGPVKDLSDNEFKEVLYLFRGKIFLTDNNID
jgi:hypothetical protein